MPQDITFDLLQVKGAFPCAHTQHRFHFEIQLRLHLCVMLCFRNKLNAIGNSKKNVPHISFQHFSTVFKLTKIR